MAIDAINSSDPFRSFSVEFRAFDRAQGRDFEVTAGQGPSFGEVLMQAVEEVQATKDKAERITLDYATGKSVDVHTMLISAAKADVALQVTSNVVSKAASSINQLMQTQI